MVKETDISKEEPYFFGINGVQIFEYDTYESIKNDPNFDFSHSYQHLREVFPYRLYKMFKKDLDITNAVGKTVLGNLDKDCVGHWRLYKLENINDHPHECHYGVWASFRDINSNVELEYKIPLRKLNPYADEDKGYFIKNVIYYNIFEIDKSFEGFAQAILSPVYNLQLNEYRRYFYGNEKIEIEPMSLFK